MALAGPPGSHRRPGAAVRRPDSRHRAGPGERRDPGRVGQRGASHPPRTAARLPERVTPTVLRRVDPRGHPLREPRARAVRTAAGLTRMAAKLDPFVDVLLREQGDQLYLLPDEPVTLVKDGKPRKVSKQPLTDQHIYALLVEVAPSESANHIDTGTETEFEYVADRGMVRVRIVPEMGRLTAAVSPKGRPAPAEAVATAPPAPPPAAQRAPSVAAAPERAAVAPSELATDFTPAQYQAAERTLGDLLRALVQSKSSDLHLRVGEPPLFRTHVELARQSGGPLTIEQLELMLLAIMPGRNRAEWKESGESDFAYEIAGLARFRVNGARDRKGPLAVFRVIPAPVVSVEQLAITKEVQQLCFLTKGLVLVTGPTGSGKSTTLCALVDLVNRMRTDHIITIEDPIAFQP